MIVNLEHGSVDLSYVPDECPWCHKKIDAKITGHHFPSDANLTMILVCPNQDCSRAFFSYYKHVRSNEYDLFNISTGNVKKSQYSKIISDISESFITIIGQAEYAEQHNLTEICGVGYRKALEFLIKDYIISKDQSQEEAIKAKWLGNCIKEHVENPMIKSMAKRAIWLGNDHAHYVKKWENHDIEDLKTLIRATIRWIELEILSEGYIQEMPERT